MEKTLSGRLAAMAQGGLMIGLGRSACRIARLALATALVLAGVTGNVHRSTSVKFVSGMSKHMYARSNQAINHPTNWCIVTRFWD